MTSDIIFGSWRCGVDARRGQTKNANVLMDCVERAVVGVLKSWLARPIFSA